MGARINFGREGGGRVKLKKRPRQKQYRKKTQNDEKCSEKAPHRDRDIVKNLQKGPPYSGRGGRVPTLEIAPSLYAPMDKDIILKRSGYSD